MQSTADIRAAFLDYFKGHGHEVVGSSPLVPRNDPSLMFTNAGMVQFKNVFTGQESRPYVRAASSQKCVRAGGKHNDLDNVGYTARHHTFFEMLGNFSFGDYFKEDAIKLGWDLVTKEFGLDQSRLLVTVHSSDEEAAGLWSKIAGLADERIIRIPTSDNFWAMGPTGPCGPCTEIFYDHGDHIPGGPPGSADEDGDRFVEIWNLVFMQFEQIDEETRIDLPKPSVDTGMGLERIAAVLQGQHDNYDIDLMRHLIEAVAAAGGTDPHGEHKASHRVIADHLRACGFLIADGVLPANDGRGYVLRRILRRAMRHAQLMGVQGELMPKLVPTLVGQMGQAFPELERAQALITETMALEESKFQSMLTRGLRLLDEETASLGTGDTLAGDVAFKLYDTYGFPLDLTQDALRARDIDVDTTGFDAAMAQQKADARAAWAGSGEAATEQVWFDIHEKAGASDFLGYATDQAEGHVAALISGGSEVDEVTAGQEVAIVLNQTPFYGESGGQIGDTGLIEGADGLSISVSDTQKKLGDMHVHLGKVETGSVKLGDEVKLTVDAARRDAIRGHHSATHLLHAALRGILGDHVTQKGSLVAEDKLRFDISHPKAMTAEQITAVEASVNTEIRANTPVGTRLMEPDAAVEAGAMALFGEKYGDEVRVVSMGTAQDNDPQHRSYSVELCGGTHVTRTGDIGLFKIVGESAVSSGVRRIEAVTGAAAEAWVAGQQATVQAVATALNTGADTVLDRVSGLMGKIKELEKDLADTRKKLVSGAGASAGPEPETINGIAFLGQVLDGVPAKDLKGMADEMKKQVGSGVVALISNSDGKASIVAGVTDDLTDRLSAVDLVRAASAAVGGKGGGGRPDMAQAGGPDGTLGNQALEAISAHLKSG